MNAIYYCKECCHAKETKKEYIGKRAKCPECSSNIKIYDTIEFIEQLAKKNIFQGRELSKIKQDFKDKEERELEELEEIAKEHEEELRKQEIEQSKIELDKREKLNIKIVNQAKTLTSNLKQIKSLKKEIEELKKNIQKLKQSPTSNKIKIVNKATNNINVNNTKEFTKQNKYIAIEKWFKQKSIKAEIDINNVDTTGFFDEIAEIIGNNYKVLKPLINQIQYIQNNDYSNLKFKLSDKGPNDIQVITSFCNQLYKYSFVSRYSYDKKLKIIWLHLQQAPKIKVFFNGIWMEWFIMIKIFKLFKDNNIDASLMRSVKITKLNKQTNELDIFILTKDNIPIYIECKTGEFREDINKYLKLQKVLDIPKENFIICILDLDNNYLDGLTSMYDLKFINENNIIKYLEKILI